MLKIQCYCFIEMLSLRGVNVAGSSRFGQFGAFTYGLKVCRQLSIVLLKVEPVLVQENSKFSQ
ncbi:Uncharacterised protein [Vibrio cholerae]|nr:Uncharacterised protein [Vibrio cholerae]